MSMPPSTTRRIGIDLKIASTPVRVEVDLPLTTVHPTEMLPLFRSLSEQLCDHAMQGDRLAGRSPSCRAGCGQCCRYLVPISPIEARHLVQIIASLPEPRREQITSRFADARRRIETAGLLDELLHPELHPSRGSALGRDYHALGIPCPFLENEACSIYENRFITCREYFVTSDPGFCQSFGHPNITTLHLPARGVWLRLATLEATPEAQARQWVPLTLAPDFVREYPEDPQPAQGPELLHKVLSRFWDI